MKASQNPKNILETKNYETPFIESILLEKEPCIYIVLIFDHMAGSKSAYLAFYLFILVTLIAPQVCKRPYN